MQITKLVLLLKKTAFQTTLKKKSIFWGLVYNHTSEIMWKLMRWYCARFLKRPSKEHCRWDHTANTPQVPSWDDRAGRIAQQICPCDVGGKKWHLFKWLSSLSEENEWIRSRKWDRSDSNNTWQILERDSILIWVLCEKESFSKIWVQIWSVHVCFVLCVCDWKSTVVLCNKL